MSPRRRTRLARGVYQDAHGISVTVKRGDQRPERRYPRGTPLAELIAARRALIDELEAVAPSSSVGALRADVAAAVATIPAGRHRRSVEMLLEHWCDATVTVDGVRTTLGQLPRRALTAVQIRSQLAVFQTTPSRHGRPFAPKTVKELRRVLLWLYTTLDGPGSPNPVREVKAPRVRYDDPRGIDYPIIERIFAAMPDRPATRLHAIRMRVMAYTGLHQVEVARLRPRDIDLARRRLWIHPREKGGGVAGEWHRLLSPAVDALRDLVAAGGLGAFNTTLTARVWKQALRVARAAWEAEEAGSPAPRPWPVHDDARPYDLRHSLGTAVYAETGDIRAAQAILRHRQLATTSRYIRAAVNPRAEKARDVLEVRLATILPHGTSARVSDPGGNRRPMAGRDRSKPGRSSG